MFDFNFPHFPPPKCPSPYGDKWTTNLNPPKYEERMFLHNSQINIFWDANYTPKETLIQKSPEREGTYTPKQVNPKALFLPKRMKGFLFLDLFLKSSTSQVYSLNSLLKLIPKYYFPPKEWRDSFFFIFSSKVKPPKFTL